MRIGHGLNFLLKRDDHASVFMHDFGGVRQTRTGGNQAHDSYTEHHPPIHEGTRLMTHTLHSVDIKADAAGDDLT
jgi:hypothetical protein